MTVFAVDVGLWVSGLAMFSPASGSSYHHLSDVVIVEPPRSQRHIAPRAMALALARAAQRMSLDGGLPGEAYRTSVWAVEHPVTRSTLRSTHADVALLQEVSDQIAAAVVSKQHFREKVKPEAWKGQVPKNVHQGRILERLSLGELELLRRYRGQKSDHPNLKEALDAIGVGLWRTGRLRGTRSPGRLQ